MTCRPARRTSRRRTEMIPDLIDDLCAFINTERPVIRGACRYRARTIRSNPPVRRWQRPRRAMPHQRRASQGRRNPYDPARFRRTPQRHGWLLRRIARVPTERKPVAVDREVRRCNGAMRASVPGHCPTRSADFRHLAIPAWHPRQGTVMDRIDQASTAVVLADADMVATELSIDPNVARRALNTLERVGIASRSQVASAIGYGGSTRCSRLLR